MNEVNALDFIGQEIKTSDIAKAEEILKMSYGVDYPAEKFTMLWQLIKEEGWTDYRLKETVKWFLMNKKFPNWTIADWFDYGVKVYSWNEYCKQLSNNMGLNKMIEWYNINGTWCWKYKDSKTLPFPRKEK